MNDRRIAATGLASLLALRGIFWGGFLALVIGRSGWTPIAVLILGPGYAVTLGYLIRVFGNPTPGWRQTIWGSSILVQGAWLVLHFIDATNHEARNLFNLPGVWWMFATVASIVGLVLEWERGGFLQTFGDLVRESWADGPSHKE